MKTSKVNLIIVMLITVFMGVMLAVSSRPASDIAIVGGVMAVLNSGVPISILLDKLVELRKAQ